MKIYATSKQQAVLLGVLALASFVAMSPQTFAQQNPAGQGQQGGVPLGGPYSGCGIQTAPALSGGSIEYTDSNNPTGPLEPVAYGSGFAVVAIMSGIGIWAAVRKH